MSHAAITPGAMPGAMFRPPTPCLPPYRFSGLASPFTPPMGRLMARTNLFAERSRRSSYSLEYPEAHTSQNRRLQ
jgi:hypothetical protein